MIIIIKSKILKLAEKCQDFKRGSYYFLTVFDFKGIFQDIPEHNAQITLGKKKHSSMMPKQKKKLKY